MLPYQLTALQDQKTSGENINKVNVYLDEKVMENISIAKKLITAVNIQGPHSIIDSQSWND